MSEETKKYNLYNSKNYLERLEENEEYYVIKYIELVNNYIYYITNIINFRTNSYNKYVIVRGLESLSHIYNVLLLYTKNLDLVLHFATKGYCFYVEYIEQMLLNKSLSMVLCCNDGIIMMYRKTIYEVNIGFRKTFILEDSDKHKLNRINLGIGYFNNIFLNYIEKDSNEKTNLEIESKNNELIKTIIGLLNRICLTKNSYIDILSLLNRITEEVIILELKKITEILELVIKKLKVHKIKNLVISYKFIEELYDENNIELIHKYSTNKIVNTILGLCNKSCEITE